MSRIDLLRKHLKDTTPAVWAEPFHEAWLASQGEDARIRFARAQRAEMAAAKPVVKPGELIVGNNALRSVVTGLPTAFRSGIFFDRAALDSARTEHPAGAGQLAEIASYWEQWTAENGAYAPMAMHASLGYEIPLTLGLDGMREKVQHWRGLNTATRPDCTAWYDALLITLDGISAFVAAHAAAAEEAAQSEPSAERRAELARMAQGCRHIAHDPPRGFLEAAQLFYFIFWLCGHDSPGPIDRYLYPALKRDLDADALCFDEAQEIVDCLWLKFEEKTAYGATIGGQLRDGSDASNELSLMCVSATRRLRLLSPRTALRWHPGLSPELMEAASECVAEGATYPAFVNDDPIIAAMVERGISIEDARDYSFVGCGQTYPHARGHGNYEDVIVNSAKPLELALNDGVDPMTGERVGSATGEPSSLGSYEQIETAYRRQMDRHVSEQIRAVNERRRRIQGRAHDFLRSLLTYSCVERGLDWHAGGADYSEGMVDMVGLTTVTDSLLAIKRGVYEDRAVSLAGLVQILNDDWEGEEALRQYFLRKIPKFGNDSDEADAVAAAETRRVNDHIKSHRTVFGGPWGMDIIGWSGAVLLGKQTGATPDGRRRGAALADCAGPAQGRNVCGLTPTLRSALKLPHRHVHGPMALSLRFPKDAVRGAEGRAKMRAAIETYFREGGQQLQISIASTADMKAAQRDPEAHRSLMVRVGGFSAYFTELEKEFQDDVIARSEMKL